MKIKFTHSHLNGLEWLHFHKPNLWKEIHDAITAIDANACKTKISKERTMHGKALISPKDLNGHFSTQLKGLGWKQSITSYWVSDSARLIRRTLALPAKQQKDMIDKAGGNPIHSSNQTDFVKERVAIEIQFGKYSFIAYDMFVKHMAFFVGDKIDLGIEILPTKQMQSQMSSGPGYYEGALYDLVRNGRGTPAVPLVVLGIEP